MQHDVMDGQVQFSTCPAACALTDIVCHLSSIGSGHLLSSGSIPGRFDEKLQQSLREHRHVSKQ